MKLRLLLPCALMVASAAYADVVSIVPLSSTVLAGDRFFINVSISQAADLYAYQFDLTFDPTVLRANSITEGSFLSSGGFTFFVPGTIDNTPAGGSITFTADTLIGALSGVTGSGVLATVEFDALTMGNTGISLSNVTLMDSTLGDRPVTVRNGSVTVVPEPSAATLALTLFAAIGLARLRRRAPNQ